MKHFKSLIIAAILGFAAHASAQTYTPWVLGGNSLSPTTPPTTAVFGTTSDNPIEIRTYNLMRMYNLPGVPTESEVLEDGARLGEMNAILLEKVEELTLYVIELQKQIDELKRQNEERE